MPQAELPFQKAQSTCVFCTNPKGKLSEVLVRFMHLDDARGNHYAQVILPTCEDHAHIPTIHYRPKGAKP